MKRILLLLVALLCYGAGRASTPIPLTSSIVSKELTNVPGNIKITVEYSVHDSVYIKDQRFKSRADKGNPIFSSLGVPPFVKYKLYVAGDKFTTDYSLKINKDDIPFYPVDLQFELEYFTTNNIKVIQPPKNPHPKNDDGFVGTPLAVKTTAKVYFTPYSSLEIWDEAAFYNLKRVWLVETDSLQERHYVSRASIPESNLDDTIDLEKEPWQDDWNMLFIDGLAYAIPMKRNSAPESINQDVEGETGKDQGANQRDGCGLSYQRYKYTISGSIASGFTNDIRNPASLGLSGLEVKFYENDLLQSSYSNIDDQYLGSAVTNAAGEFEFNFNICQSRITEGSNIELYLVVKAKDPNYDIKAKTSFGRISGNNLPFFTRRAIIGNFKLGRTGDDRRAFNLRQRNISDGSHRSVVYVQRAIDFSRDNEVNVGGGITVWSYFPMVGGTGFFMPSELLYVVKNPVSMVADGRPGIYIDSNNSGDENTTYHEFGHYLMWRLQRNNWLNPLTASFIDYNVSEEENPNISWTEGWANGFMAICDMANYDGSGSNFRTLSSASSNDYIINSPIITNPYDSTYAHPVTVSPNPFENTLRFRVESEETEDLTISILNMQGIEVYRESRFRTNTIITIPNDWKAGYYVIRAIYAGTVEERKILKGY